ncbi:hypothetical protein P5V15_002766 [Pogonomyrmex californicus]
MGHAVCRITTLCFSAPSERAEIILEACTYYHYRGHAYNILLPLSRQKVAEIIPRSENNHIWLFYSHQSPDMSEIQRFVYWLRVKAAIEKRKKKVKKCKIVLMRQYNNNFKKSRFCNMEHLERVERELLEQCSQVATLVECFAWLQRCEECIEQLEELSRVKRPRLTVANRQSAVARVA